jgi:hypothetical protein
MEPIDPAVFVGRDPEWREAWEELDAESRRRVTAVVTDGSRLDDPALEPFLYSLIARRRRHHRWRIVQAVITLTIGTFWAVATTEIRPSLWSWFFIPLLIVFLTVLPLPRTTRVLETEAVEIHDSLDVVTEPRRLILR